MASDLNLAAKFCPITVDVRGKLAFCRIASSISGEELKKDQERRAQMNRPTIDKPYTTITLEDPVILHPEQVPDIVKQVLTERFITKEVDGVMRQRYYAVNKSPFLPNVVYSKEAGVDKAGQEIASNDYPLPAELATGLDVTLGVRFYLGKLNNVGVGFNYVKLNEPVRMYAKSGLEASLASEGVAYKPATGPLRLDESGQVISEPAPAPQAANTTPVSVSPMAQPDPQAAPATPQTQAQAAQAQADPMVSAFPQGGASFTDPNAGVPNLQYQPQ